MKPGPKRTINVGDRVHICVASKYFGQEGVVIEYIPATSTSWGSYVRVLFEDNATRRFRPAEVQEVGERERLHQLRKSYVPPTHSARPRTY